MDARSLAERIIRLYESGMEAIKNVYINVEGRPVSMLDAAKMCVNGDDAACRAIASAAALRLAPCSPEVRAYVEEVCREHGPNFVLYAAPGGVIVTCSNVWHHLDVCDEVGAKISEMYAAAVRYIVSRALSVK